jgi:hypothetical protein
MGALCNSLIVIFIVWRGIGVDPSEINDTGMCRHAFEAAGAIIVKSLPSHDSQLSESGQPNLNSIG